MFVCPYDAHLCSMQACRSGICEMTGSSPLIACLGCGVVVERSGGFRLCLDCIAIESPIEKEGA